MLARLINFSPEFQASEKKHSAFPSSNPRVSPLFVCLASCSLTPERPHIQSVARFRLVTLVIFSREGGKEVAKLDTKLAEKLGSLRKETQRIRFHLLSHTSLFWSRNSLLNSIAAFETVTS